jgi:DNA-binding response OmpR family regulator
MRKILIIDDERDFCFFIKQNLELVGGYNVIVATSGREGISAAARHKPDVILLDIMMPQMDGFAVLKELKSKEATTAIPVIMLTAVDSDGAKEKASGLYNEDYITKPVEIAALRTKIDGVLSRGF